MMVTLSARPCFSTASCRSYCLGPIAPRPLLATACNTRMRNRIERMFNRFKPFGRIAARYDKTAKSFLGFLQAAPTKIGLKLFVNGT